MKVELRLTSGAVYEVTRPSPEASWRTPHACPECGLTPLRVRSYPEEERVTGGLVSAPAWCAGRHGSIGELVVVEPDRPGLLFMGVEPEEQPRCRVYTSDC